MKLNITSVTRYDKDREGKPLMTRDNRPYTRLVIRTKEYDKPLSGFDSIQTQNLKEGDVLEAEVEQKGEYLNFKLPNKQDLLGKQLEELQSRVMKIQLMVEKIGQVIVPKEKDEIPYPEGEPEDIPF